MGNCRVLQRSKLSFETHFSHIRLWQHKIKGGKDCKIDNSARHIVRQEVFLGVVDKQEGILMLWEESKLSFETSMITIGSYSRFL